MKWNNILSQLIQGMPIRRKSWDKDIWVELGEEPLFSYPIILLDQEENEVELLDEDLRANDWEIYYGDELDYREMSLERYLQYLKCKSSTVNYHIDRLLQLSMRDYAEKHNSVACLDEGSRLYYIVYSNMFCDFWVEETYSIMNPTTVYFNDKQVAMNYIREHKTMLDDIMGVHDIRSILFNSRNLWKEDLIQLENELDRLLRVVRI